MFEKVNLIKEWRNIPDFPEYEVSNFGEVRRGDKILKQYNKKGYKLVYIYNSLGRKCFLVHRLVALVFLPNTNNLPEVNHKDENPENNFVENLEWCSSKYNANYGHHIEHCKNSLKKSGKSWLGRKHSELSKQKMSKAKKGCVLTEECKRKISSSLLDRPKDLKTREKISISKGRKVIMDGEIVFNSLSRCGQFFGVNSSSIQFALKNQNGIYRGHFIEIYGGNNYGL